MSRPPSLLYQQEEEQQQLPPSAQFYYPKRPANVKRLRQQYETRGGVGVGGRALPIYGRSYSLEEEDVTDDLEAIPVYSKFIYAKQRQQMPPRQLYQLGDSLSSLDEDFDYNGGYIIESTPPAPPHAPPAGHNVVRNLNALGRLLEILQRWPLPCLSFNTACICSLIVIFLAPRTCAQNLLFPAYRLFFGTLYPAYASYKAVRTKNVKEYVKWMMYWIVFAFFTCIETFTDIFLSWFPFYYEVKVVIVLWLLSPATKGSSTLYRKFVHPMLTRREQEIDEYLNQAKERGYSAVLQLGSKGVNYATNVIMQTAIKFAMAAAPTTRGIQMSQSDNDLYVSRDDTDHQWMPRSSSLTILDTYAETEYEYNGDVLGDDDNEIMEVEELLVGDAGAARLRDLPSRKTQSKRATATVAATRRGSKTRSTRGESSSGTAGGIRGRRKLREATPDVDVEGD
ncbi:uncharacterized protein Dwil_GK19544, isoform E [Drosophila willistoni]|uniref:Uncharacterized protein, isoform E n=1 Tax=Drosophila willistoni TaxID=7260 RepID=A0A0Q9X053_DROWI|nr:uncharacterized protein Dwil_GK19544, isoform E [Drosophila willistoni]